MWHIPASPLNVKIVNDSGSSYRRELLALGSGNAVSSDEYKTFSCLEQLKDNIHGRTAGFSLSLALVSLVYLFKWLEIYTDMNASKGAQTFAKNQARSYLLTFLMMLFSFFACREYSQYVAWMWVASNCTYLANTFLWYIYLELMYTLHVYMCVTTLASYQTSFIVLFCSLVQTFYRVFLIYNISSPSLCQGVFHEENEEARANR